MLLPKNNITAFIINNNKEPIPQALKSQLSWCREIKEGVLAAGTSVLNLNIKTRWVFFIYPWEEPSKELSLEIQNFINEADEKFLTGAQVTIQNQIWGKKIKFGRFGPTLQTRVGRRVGEWKEKNGQLFWDFPGRKKSLENPLLARPFINLADFLHKTNEQTTKQAQVLLKKGKKSNWLKISLKPLLTILKNFFGLSFLDGFIGLILSLLSGFEVFLVESKLWVASQKKSFSNEP